jgi:hypothetical protein
MGLNLSKAAGQKTKVLIPDNTIARVLMRIKKGGHNNPEKGWSGEYVKYNKKTGVAYLNCEAFVLEGEYAQQRIRFRIGLESPNSDEYQTMGLDFMRSIVDSAHGLMPDDDSPEAIKIRDECNFSDLDGLEFTALIDVEIGFPPYKDRNVINVAITPDDERYLKKLSKTKPSKTIK